MRNLILMTIALIVVLMLVLGVLAPESSDLINMYLQSNESLVLSNILYKIGMLIVPILYWFTGKWKYYKIQ